MKEFFKIYVFCYIVCMLLGFFGLGMLLENFLGVLGVICLPLALMFRMFLYYEEKIKTLEQRVAALEGEKNETSDFNG